jgi:hypothetical protein
MSADTRTDAGLTAAQAAALRTMAEQVLRCAARGDTSGCGQRPHGVHMRTMLALLERGLIAPRNVLDKAWHDWRVTPDGFRACGLASPAATATTEGSPR